VKDKPVDETDLDEMAELPTLLGVNVLPTGVANVVAAPSTTAQPAARAESPAAAAARANAFTGDATTMLPSASAAGVVEGRRPVALRGAGTRRPGKMLKVDWPACKAHGLCHELLPEAVGLDEWGFPIVSREPLRGLRLDDGKRAVAACPTLALRLIDAPQ